MKTKMNYDFIDYIPNEYNDIINIKIKDTECKHISINASSKQKNDFEALSNMVGYNYCYMSQGDNFNVENDKRYVLEMAKLPRLRPAKFVITKDNRVWADNTHTSIAIILQKGFEARIRDANYYLVDLRPSIIKIINPPRLTRFVYKKIIENAQNIQDRLNLGWRPINCCYTIGDLIIQNKYLQ